VAAPNTVKFCLRGITPVTVLSSSVVSATSSFFPSQFSTTAFPMATADVQEIRATSYVGFDSITQQIEHKLLKRGFQFNVIVVGASRAPFLTALACRPPRKRNMLFNGWFWLSGPTGLGKSTLINTIFASHLIDSKGRREADEPVRQTTEIQTVSHGAVFSLPLFDLVTLHVTPLTRMPRCSHHGERRAAAP
jgi:hypothetical protein